jgi:rhodanese-related sulfurtransferase
MYPDQPAAITAVDAAEKVRGGSFLLDVREQYEWTAGHAPGAVHIPLSELNARAGELPADADIICVCHVGGRSAMVTDALNRGGWRAVNLEGGMQAWQDAGLPVIDDQGNAGTVV